MGFLLRLLLGAFGLKIRTRPNLTEVSKTVEHLHLLRVPKKARWFWGGVLHALAVLGTLSVFFFLRVDQVTHGYGEIAALIVAMCWSFIGPALIWHYERYTIPLFALQCKKVFMSDQQFLEMRKMAYSNLYALTLCRYITSVWIVSVIYAFYRSREFVLNFGISGANDPFLWIMLIGTVLFAYYTSIGFCFSYKAYKLTQLVSRADLDERIFHQDEVLGLSFVGEFAFKTAAMFFSGWLFAPLVFLAGYRNAQTDYFVPALLLGIYLVFTVAAFFAPIYLVHQKILKEKAHLAKGYYEIANLASQQLIHTWSETDAIKLRHSKEMLSDIKSISNWPLNLGMLVKFSASSLIFPALAAILTTYIKH